MRGAAHQRTLILKLYNMKKVSTILRYVIGAIIIFAILNYCQELNDCLMNN